ncbi:hypothetical protein HOO68_04460, partial [Candidatus Gracilibacteria bacterium]|nr:hypothetical protein [Candidatus Gracilibacteria bacterium]
MKYFFTGILVFLISSIFLYTFGYASVDIPGTAQITAASIEVNIANDGSVTSAKDFGFQILQILKIAVSGVAIIYMVLIGAYMVIGSDSEDTVKTQRKQIIYAIVAFLFLNLPSLAYTVFFLDTTGVSVTPAASWSSMDNGFFWNNAGFEGIFGNIVAFLRVFIFGAAVTMFTWGF